MNLPTNTSLNIRTLIFLIEKVILALSSLQLTAQNRLYKTLYYLALFHKKTEVFTSVLVVLYVRSD